MVYELKLRHHYCDKVTVKFFPDLGLNQTSLMANFRFYRLWLDIISYVSFYFSSAVHKPMCYFVSHFRMACDHLKRHLSLNMTNI